MYADNLVFVGTIASSKSLQELDVFTGFISVLDGKINKKGSEEEFKELQRSGAFSNYKVIKLGKYQFMMPGLVDCHTHAPQFPNIGLGLDRPLLEWLDKYTFPLESKYSDVKFAGKVYDQVVKRLIHNGTTTACYFSSLHLEGTMELVKSVARHHQRALIGKVSMNVKNDAGYYNNTDKELPEVVTFVKSVLSYKNNLIQPVITPRFAISCDRELMTELAKIAAEYNCRIQSHISENCSEIECVLKTYPDCKSYAEVYDKSNILSKNCIMAHAVHLTDDEIKVLATKEVSVAHCPASNTRLRSGLCPVKKLIDNNIIVGLGTDISGGDNATIMDAMRRAMDVSTHLQLRGDQNTCLDWTEAFYLATLGGANALKLGHVIGNFEINKEFDALVVDVYASEGPIDNYEFAMNSEEHASHLLQRFLYLGDDRNIQQVYIKGVKVKDTCAI